MPSLVTDTGCVVKASDTVWFCKLTQKIDRLRRMYQVRIRLNPSETYEGMLQKRAQYLGRKGLLVFRLPPTAGTITVPVGFHCDGFVYFGPNEFMCIYSDEIEPVKIVAAGGIHAA